MQGTGYRSLLLVAPLLLFVAIDKGYAQKALSKFRLVPPPTQSLSKIQWDEFDLLPTDRYFYIDNNGLTRVVAQLNGYQFKLVVDPLEVQHGQNTYLIPRVGIMNIDIAALLNNGQNRMRIQGTGPPGAEATIIIADHLIGNQIDYVLNLVALPEVARLSQNFPNPFNAGTTINYQVPQRLFDGVDVQLDIFNLLGEKVRTLVRQRSFPGTFPVKWDGTDDRGISVASGAYLYRLVVGEFKQTKRLLLLK
jgi:hypothetical protein